MCRFAKSEKCAQISRDDVVSSCTSNNENGNVRPGYTVGDVVIAMTYGSIARGAVMEGKAPPMRICFP